MALALLSTILYIGNLHGQEVGNVSTLSSPVTSLVSSPRPYIRYSGTLKDESGNPRSGTFSLTFSLYETQHVPVPLWVETHDVTPDQSGKYSVLLGSRSPQGLPIDLFTSRQVYWVGIRPESELELPRTLIVPVAYALKAIDADTVGGRPASDFVSWKQMNSLITLLPIPILPPKPGGPVKASSFESTTPLGPSFISDAPSGPPLQVTSTELVRNLNVDFLHGLPDTAFAKTESANEFAQNQLFQTGISFPSLGNAKVSGGTLSAPLDMEASSYSSATNTAIKQIFRWHAGALNNNTSTPSGQLSLLFGNSKSTLAETGLWIGFDGVIHFASNQTLPVNAVLEALNGSGPNGTGNPDGPAIPPVVDTGSYPWDQTPNSPSVLQAGPNTVQLTPCPRGVNGTDQWHYLYISGTGTPESVLISGGTCTSRAPSGTIEFVANYSHPKGYKLGSATGGLQEAINDAATKGSQGQVSRNVLITPGNYTLHARLSVRTSGVQITASGATLTCLMNDTCIMLGDPANANMFSDIVLTGLRIRPGVTNGTWAAIEDNAQNTQINDFAPVGANATGLTFGYLVQVDNDQAALINHLDTNSAPWARCDTSFCSTAVYAPGPFSQNAAVLWIKNSPMSLQCQANGVDNLSGNTLHIEDSVIQAYPQFGIRSRATFGLNPAVQLDNVYQEVGNCQNPLRTGIAGLIVENGYATKTGGEGPVGALPLFANTGTNQYNYYVVVNSSVMGVSPPYLAGYALTNGNGSIAVLWNQVGNAGTVTYDILRVPGSLSEGGTAPFGTGNFAIATGIPATGCVNRVCSFTDNVSSAAKSYSISPLPAYSPSLYLWPASIVLTSSHDVQNTGGLVPTRYFTDTLQDVSIVNSAGASQPSVFAQQCSELLAWSPVWVDCQAGDSISNDFPPVVGTVMQLSNLGGSNGGLKGRLIFEPPPLSSLYPTHIITLFDSDPVKTLSAPMHRPAWDSQDAFIGLDNPQGTSPTPNGRTQISFGAPVAISNYIANVGDGVNWLERLTAQLKSFKVPVSAPSFQTTSNCASSVGSCGSAAAGRITIAAGATQVTVLSTAVTSTSEINVNENRASGPALGVVCNTDWGRNYRIAQQNAGSFVVETNAPPVGNPACLNYSIVN